MSEKLGCLEWWGLGVFIAPTTNSTVGEVVCRWAHRTVRCATGHCQVRQPRHPTVRVLTVSTVGALTSCPTGQSGVAPNSYCSVTVVVGHCAGSRCSAWCTGQSGGTPDSLVNYSGAASEKPKGEEFRLYGPWHTGHSGAPDQGSLRFLFAPFF
jgi:hypothetical protein